MAKKKIPEKNVEVLPEGVPAPYGIRKTFDHVVNVKKKRTNSIVRMKPLKDRQNIYEVPQFCPAGYTKEQFDRYREEFQRIRQHTKEDLKEVLKLNKQDTNINLRAEILDRCADGYALGRIPTCPHCYGTNPVYDKHKGTYFCPGYKDGEQLVKCETIFTRQELPRKHDWNNDFENRQAIRLQRTEKKLKHQREYQIQYKKDKKKRLAREERRRQGLPSESQGEDEDKAEKKQALIKKQTTNFTPQQEQKIESERQDYRIESEREDSKRIESERE